MKKKLLKALHFFKLDVLLLRVLERLSTALAKKHVGLSAMLEELYGGSSATVEETTPIIA